jgi:hypothetical protein
VWSNEPALLFIAAYHPADDQVIGTIVIDIRCSTRELTPLSKNHAMPLNQSLQFPRYRCPSAWRTRHP